MTTRMHASVMLGGSDSILEFYQSQPCHRVASLYKKIYSMPPASLLFYRQVMSMLDPKTIQMFHFNGPKHTTPNCPVDMLPDFNPSSGAQSYSRSTKDCKRSSYYRIPFFLSRPKIYEEWSVNAHEARPGHHTQVTKCLQLHHVDARKRRKTCTVYLKIKQKQKNFEKKKTFTRVNSFISPFCS